MRGGGGRRPRPHRLGRQTVKVWRGDQLVRTIEAHTDWAAAVLPGGARFVSGSEDGTAKLFTFGGELERTSRWAGCLRAALPDGVHFVVGLTTRIEVRLYRVDGTLVRLRRPPSAVRGGGDARRPVHHQRLDGQDRQGVERRQQEPRDTCVGTPTKSTLTATPTASAPQRLGDKKSACGSSTAPTRTPSSCTPAGAAAALPGQPARALRSTTRPSSSSMSMPSAQLPSLHAPHMG